MSDNTAYEKNLKKYQIYVAISGFTTVGPLLNLFYLTADISFSQLSSIETMSLIVLVFLEVPSGMMADLLGRKISIFIGCLLMGCEFLFIAAGFTLPVFIFAALIGGIGISLESGADESLLYDSLKKLNRENEFQKYIGRSGAIFKISAAVAGLLWGYIYQLDPTFVFYLAGVMFILLGFFSLTMKETVTIAPRITAPSSKNIAYLTLSNSAFSKRIKNLCLRSYCTIKNNNKLLWMILFTSLLSTTIRAHTAIIRAPMLEKLIENATYMGCILAIGLGLSSIVSWYANKLISTAYSGYILLTFPLIAAFVFIASGIFYNLSMVLLIFLIYMLNAYKTVFMSNYWHKQFSSRQRGTLVSFTEACQSLIGIFTLMSTGFLADALGLRLSSITIGAFVLSFSVLLIFVNRGTQSKTLVKSTNIKAPVTL